MDHIIIEILQAVGVHDFLMDKLKDEDELLRLFQDDFGTLMELCQE